MLKRISEFVYKYKWIVMAFWVMLALLIFFKAPVLSEVAKSSEVSFLPASSDAIKAANLTNELFADKSDSGGILLTMSRNGQLTQSDSQYAIDLENYLNANKQLFAISEITSPFSKKEFEKVMISKDKKAALISINTVKRKNIDEYSDVINALTRDIAANPALHRKGAPQVPQGLTIHVTGSTALLIEQNTSMKNSMALTGKITVILVALVLLLIYRSPIAPLLPLFTIGLSFLISRGIVAIIAKWGLKVSSYTETFLIAVLFGAGTDYCLLLISRFKEELSQGKTKKEAIISMATKSGIAVVSSAITVMIGFIFMGLAKFGLFNTTGPSIAIGVGITLLAVMTFTPAVISAFGEKIFWPVRPSAIVTKGALPSKKALTFWEKLANSVTARPLRYIAICVVVLIPFLISLTGAARSYDQLQELPSSADSIKGFQVIKDHFNQGEMLPVKVVLKTDKSMWDSRSLQTLDTIADDIMKIDNVAKVRTATRPLGDKITQATVTEQLKMFSAGIKQANGGFQPIQTGLDKMHQGVNAIAQGLEVGKSQLGKLNDGTRQAGDGIAAIKSGLGALSSGQQSAIDGNSQIESGLQQLSDGTAKSKDGVDQVRSTLQDCQKRMELVMTEQPMLALNPDYQAAYNMVKGISTNMDSISSGLNSIIDGLAKSKSGIVAANTGFKGVKGGIDESDKATKQILDGLKAIENGQKQFDSQLTIAYSKLMEISKGFEPTKEGIGKMQAGMGQMQNTVGSYISGGSQLDEGFFLPPNAFTMYPKLKDAMNLFISPDGKGVTMDVILKTPPYTSDSLDTISQIRYEVGNGLKGTYLKNAEFHLGGSTSSFSEVRDITSQDFIVVMFFVLTGIFIVLVILLRSLVAPIYLILTILLSYGTTMGITYLVFQVGLGHDGLSWTAPFFAFCLLVALGVDYNIFLMSRVKEEYAPGDVTGSVKRALSSTGGIITSCGIIMAGTFGALVASPMSSLMQIGFATVVGLLLDTFIVRCLLVPAIAVKVGELNWWPGRKVKIVPYE